MGGEDEDEDEVDVDHGRDEYEEMIGRDDFHEDTINYENVNNVRHDVMDDHDDDVMDDQDNIGNGIGVQHVTATVPTYEAHGSSFHANTWDNIVDPSNVEIPFSSSWVRGMNFSKGLIFPIKEAVKQERFNHDISYYKIWDAKQKAIANIHGNWEESYQKLQKLLLEYKDSDLGTQGSFRSINGDIPGTIIFKYVFWAFASSIARFAHCRPLMSIDGTHLYGKYRGKLLIAMATDANNEIFPLAFAVVER
ncbi:hypothetical protein SO802_002934 [Lithocarpus litseifolius]|uniref:MULE transposase domain-containing protein n=1 Tax=Lithocarpus litseifolius TaxID=425828 RepID=A0AAW2E2S8_9ROSI